MSAQVSLAAMFPPAKDEMWNKDIFWQPIPVHTVSKECGNNNLAAPMNCPKYDAALKMFMQESPKLKEIYTKYADLFAFWSKMCGANLTTIDDVSYLYDTLYVEKINNKS